MTTFDGVEAAIVAGREIVGTYYDDPAGATHEVVRLLLINTDGPEIDRSGVGVIGLSSVDQSGVNWWEVPAAHPISESVLAQVLGMPIAANWWQSHRQGIESTVREGRKLVYRTNWTSLDKEMIGVSVPGRFIKTYDYAGLVAEHYDLTQFKPWQAHQDYISLIEESYQLTVISGYPSTPPRFVSQVVYNEGVLVEWEPPADRGSAPIQEYRLYRGPNSGSMVLIATLGGAVRHYFDEAAPAGSIYKLYAFNGVLESDPTFSYTITDPDLLNISFRDCVTGDGFAGLPYAGWMGVRQIDLLPDSTICLLQGSSGAIVPTVHPADATVPTLLWTATRPDLVRVDQDGSIHALSPGRSVITASSIDGTHKTASVAVICYPAFMVDDLKAYLEAQELGIPIFTRRQPDGVDRCVTLIQLRGQPADAHADEAHPQLQVLIRSTDLTDAENLRKIIHDLLHGLGPATINGTRYSLLESFTTGAYYEKERKVPRFVSTISFMVGRELTINQTADPARANEITGRS